MNKQCFKKFLPYILVIVGFVALAYAYFPAQLKGDIVAQSDISMWRGGANETIEFREATGEEPLWTGSMFSGMPTTMVSTIYEGNLLEHLYDLMFVGDRPVSYIVLSLVGFFLLMLSFGASVPVAIIGGIAFAFSTYNMQIIQVGHNSKMVAMAFMPMVLASIVYAYKKNILLGSILFAITLSFEIMANHFQITYYLAMIILFYLIAECHKAVKESKFGLFVKKSVIILVAVVFAALSNVNHLWPAWEYTKYTMRGGSELTFNKDNQSQGGLSKDYATQWSYGIDETANMMIPNYKGGSSTGSLDRESNTFHALKNQVPAAQLNDYMSSLPIYWGPQPFTAGPVYLGAIIIFLFLLGLCVLRGRTKWWIASVSLLALMLSWGHHFGFLTDIFMDYVPLYNKFRAVSMILVVLQLTVPLLGVYALSQIIEGKIERERLIKGLKIAAGVTAGFSLLVWLIPSIAGSFMSASDSQLPEVLRDSLIADRKDLLKSDAMRSFIFIVLSAGTIWIYAIEKLKKSYSLVVLGLLVLVDLWGVDKRFLNDSHFVSKREFNNQFALRKVDELILKDKDPSYRVLDLTVNIFNNSTVSYHHKTIGGYSAAKLQRYQDIIDYRLDGEINKLVGIFSGQATIAKVDSVLSASPTLNMLNTRYIVLNPNGEPLDNPYALGNAWFVDSYDYVQNPDEEIKALNVINPENKAVVDVVFKESLGDFAPYRDSLSSIELISYKPNRMEYKYNTAQDGLAVFSEVYYPKGWKAYVDGEDIPLVRADYILRAAKLKAGEHDLVLEYKPDSYFKGATYSMIASLIILLSLIVYLIYAIVRRKGKCTCS